MKTSSKENFWNYSTHVQVSTQRRGVWGVQTTPPFNWKEYIFVFTLLANEAECLYRASKNHKIVSTVEYHWLWGIHVYILLLVYTCSDSPYHFSNIYKTIVIRAASWPHYIKLCVSTHELLMHTCMQDGFSVAKMSPLLRRVFAFNCTNEFTQFHYAHSDFVHIPKTQL